MTLKEEQETQLWGESVSLTFNKKTERERKS